MLKACALAIRKWCIDHRKIAIALRALFLGVPPLIWGYAVVRFSKELPFQKELIDFFTGHEWAPFVALLWVLVMSVVIEIVADVLESMAGAGDAGRIELMALCTAIDDIVGRKLKRFGEYAKKVRTAQARGDVFGDITQPEKQIEALIQSLWHMLGTVTQDTTLKVVLAKMDKGLPVAWVCHFPNDSVPSSQLFQAETARRSFFANCAKEKTVVLIPDIGKYLEGREEKKKKGQKNKQCIYIAGNDPVENKGSIIAYPVLNRHLDQLPFVLTVKSDTATIDEAFKTKHKFIVDAFIKRLELEHNLLCIKEGVSHAQQETGVNRSIGEVGSASGHAA